MHLNQITLLPREYPTTGHYPFNLRLFQVTERIPFETPVTFFAGENGTGKSTLLEAITVRSGIHIWRDESRNIGRTNRYERQLFKYLRPEWTDGRPSGAYFGSDTFRYFSESVEGWAASNPDVLRYFGGGSLITQSHGQSIMAYFKARFKIKGLYLLDEPETALSPRSQVALVKLLRESGRAGAQFIVATHSPILLACPEARILSFDRIPVGRIAYKETAPYNLYKAFMSDPAGYIEGLYDH
jgi:predicted ATPase